MTVDPVKSHRPVGSTGWIFPWKPRKHARFPKILALAATGVFFTFLVTTVRIRVEAPEGSASGKASVIFLGESAQGRALTLRAREGGPFPSRFELSQWEGLPDLEAAAMDLSRFKPPLPVPALQDLPAEDTTKPMELAAKGVRFFPKRTVSLPAIPDPGQMKATPVLYALSGVTAGSLPRELPVLEGPVDRIMSGTPWRFLARLNPDGSVAECVSLEKGGEAGATRLEGWLRRVVFQPEPSKAARWVGVGIGFTNQPVDATDAR